MIPHNKNIQAGLDSINISGSFWSCLKFIPWKCMSLFNHKMKQIKWKAFLVCWREAIATERILGVVGSPIRKQ